MDKQTIHFQLTGGELEMFDDLMEITKVSSPKTLLVVLMIHELQRVKKEPVAVPKKMKKSDFI